MIVRHHTKDGAVSSAVYSDCEAYRYSLTRVWDTAGKRLVFAMLNPSKATEIANDPTIERCERRARKLGFGAFQAVNLFAFRATDPRDLKRSALPIGEHNNAQLLDAAQWADTLICAWGVHGAHQGRGAEVKALLEANGHALWHLGLSKEGHPRHPLYLPYTTPISLW